MFSSCTTGIGCQSTFCAIVANLEVVSEDGTSSALGVRASNLLDGNNGTNWVTATDNAAVTLGHTSKAMMHVERYSITSASSSPSGSDPAEWILSASMDGTVWTTIDSRQAQGFGGPYETRSYELNTTASAAFLRFQVTGAAWPGNSTVIPTLSFFHCSGQSSCSQGGAISVPDCVTEADGSVNPVGGTVVARTDPTGIEFMC